MYRFFGLAIDYKLGLHEEVFSLCYYGKGGFTWNEVYNMPIHLRRYYIRSINKAIDDENKNSEQYKKQQSLASPPVPSFRRK